jgi:DNA-binding NarL/FixJ family response regulator
MGDLVDERPLTRRQQQVLRLLDAGLSPQLIAAGLDLSLPTVRNHISALLHRLGCHSQLEAVATARRRGLL